MEESVIYSSWHWREACVSNLAPRLYLELSIKVLWVFFSAILKEEHVKRDRRRVNHIWMPKPEIIVYANSGPGFKQSLLLGWMASSSPCETAEESWRKFMYAWWGKPNFSCICPGPFVVNRKSPLIQAYAFGLQGKKRLWLKATFYSYSLIFSVVPRRDEKLERA